jgi:hypothetical protein
VLKTNSTPVLAVTGDKSVTEGSLLTFAVNATDSDLPAQQITYSLDSKNLPDGATIDPVTGAFSWTPTEDQGPGAYNIRIRATDDGTPPLSDSFIVLVNVAEANVPPALDVITNRTAALGDTVSLTASATDSDLPPQLITYDFASTPPSGASRNWGFPLVRSARAQRMMKRLPSSARRSNNMASRRARWSRGAGGVRFTTSMRALRRLGWRRALREPRVSNGERMYPTSPGRPVFRR